MLLMCCPLVMVEPLSCSTCRYELSIGFVMCVEISFMHGLTIFVIFGKWTVAICPNNIGTGSWFLVVALYFSFRRWQSCGMLFMLFHGINYLVAREFALPSSLNFRSYYLKSLIASILSIIKLLGLWKITKQHPGWSEHAICPKFCESRNATKWVLDKALWRGWINNTHCWPHGFGGRCCVLISYFIQLYNSQL